MVNPGRKALGAVAAIALGVLALGGCSTSKDSEVIEEPDGVEEVITDETEGDHEKVTEDESVDGEVIEEESVEETK